MARRTSILAAAVVPIAIAGLSTLPRSPGPGNFLVTSSRSSNVAIEAVTCDPEPEDAAECHRNFPTGCTDSDNPGYDAYLNFLKNQTGPFLAANEPKVLARNDFASLDRNTPKDLSSRNHEDFRDDLQNLHEGDTRAIVGYLYYAKPSGAETSNCKLTNEEDVDFHIGLGFTPKSKKALGTIHKPSLALQQESVIVEMTPHTRKEGWTDQSLQDNRGKAVKVTGQLMIDNEHNNPAQNCGFGNADTSKCWRMSAWELHPVTAFLVCSRSDGACDANSPDSDWTELTTAADNNGAASAPGKRQ